MPNINLDDAYILDETGAQVDKVTGLFTKDEGTTEEEKAFAQLNIGASGGGGGGRNLLDNPFFQVNQRGFTSNPGTNNVRCVDRWFINNGGGTGGATTLNSDGTMTITSGTVAQTFQQSIKIVPSALLGKTLCMSIMMSDGTIYSASGEVTAQTSTTKELFRVNFTEGRVFVYLQPAGTNIITPQLQVYTGKSITVRAMKLELGSVSTLANDAPPDKDIELQKCKAAQLMLKNGAANFVPIGFCGYSSGTEARIFIPTTIEMWKASMKAAVAKTGEVVLNMNGQSIDITTLTLTDVLSNGVYVKGILATSVSPSYTLGALCLQANASILLDCNL